MEGNGGERREERGKFTSLYRQVNNTKDSICQPQHRVQTQGKSGVTDYRGVLVYKLYDI